MELYIIRIMRCEDIDFLKEMLFEAIFLPQEIKNKLSKDIINQPELNKYFIDWGRPGDLAYVAETSLTSKLIGCIWGRLFTLTNKGYGFIDEQTPELSVALSVNYRNQGIGTALGNAIIHNYRQLNYKKLSLNVNESNPSLRLYERFDFKIVKREADSFIMVKEL